MPEFRQNRPAIRVGGAIRITLIRLLMVSRTTSVARLALTVPFPSRSAAIVEGGASPEAVVREILSRALIANEIVAADGAAQVGPAACAPIVEHAGGPDVSFETLCLSKRSVLWIP